MSDKLSADEFKELADRVQKAPDAKDLALFRKQLPHFPRFLETTGDLAFQAVNKLLASIQFAGAGRELFEASWNDFRQQLGLEASPPLERALVQHAALCWLRLYTTEMKYDAIVNGEGCTIDQAQYWEGRLSAASRRFLRAMETLARVRKLQLPPMQVNIAGPGGQQVNVMGPVNVKSGGPRKAAPKQEKGA